MSRLAVAASQWSGRTFVHIARSARLRARSRIDDTILDLAPVAGAAWDLPGGGYEPRAFVLGAKGKIDDHFVELNRVVTDLVFGSGAKVVSIENDTGCGKGSITLRGYHAVAAKAARVLGCTVVRTINSSQAGSWPWATAAARRKTPSVRPSRSIPSRPA